MSFRNKGHVDIEVRYKPNAATKLKSAQDLYNGLVCVCKKQANKEPGAKRALVVTLAQSQSSWKFIYEVIGMIINSNPLKPLHKQNIIANKEQSRKCAHVYYATTKIDTTTDNSAKVGEGGTKGLENNGIELVPLPRRRAVERPISLSTTDVTKRTASND
ncbi:hypothetical protein EVAR_72891_1, partial [Eumeta japonica]